MKLLFDKYAINTNEISIKLIIKFILDRFNNSKEESFLRNREKNSKQIIEASIANSPSLNPRT
tara:strand:- start:389 stop:577 length:189 start_codon:yes stop_codon:yes gene_type:complete